MSARKRTREIAEAELPPAKRELDDRGEGSVAPPTSNAELVNSSANEQTFKDEEFWLEDGTVLIVARDIEFRVYKGLLAGQSPVFKDLFAQKHPLRKVIDNDGQAQFCPVVHVEDSPEDLRCFLRACVPTEAQQFWPSPDPSVHDIAAYIRLGDKYKVHTLHDQALQYLKDHFPPDYDSYVKCMYTLPAHWDTADAIKVINLAKETGEYTILPAAFLMCIVDIRFVIRGLIQEDGSKEVLSEDDLATCCEFNEKIYARFVDGIQRTFRTSSCANCTSPKQCSRNITGVLKRLNVGDLMNNLLFRSCNTYIHPREWPRVCYSCNQMLQNRFVAESKAVWAELPKLLCIDIPGWGRQSSPEPRTHLHEVTQMLVDRNP